jgi:hypothetical protein
VKRRRIKKLAPPLKKQWKTTDIMLDLVYYTKEIPYPVYKHPDGGYVIADNTPRTLIWWQDYIGDFLRIIRASNPEELAVKYLVFFLNPEVIQIQLEEDAEVYEDDEFNN